jgi:hypothetical protein
VIPLGCSCKQRLERVSFRFTVASRYHRTVADRQHLSSSAPKSSVRLGILNIFTIIIIIILIIIISSRTCTPDAVRGYLVNVSSLREAKASRPPYFPPDTKKGKVNRRLPETRVSQKVNSCLIASDLLLAFFRVIFASYLSSSLPLNPTSSDPRGSLQFQQIFFQ